MTAEQLDALANKLAREGCTPNNAGPYVLAIRRAQILEEALERTQALLDLCQQERNLES